MSSSKMTLIGLKQFMDANNTDLFLHLSLPSDIDKDAVIDNILLRGGEFEVMYSNPYLMRDSLVSWSKKWHWTFEKWAKAVKLQYEPIENYDRYEEFEDSGEKNTERDISLKGTQIDNSTSENKTDTNTKGSPESNNTITQNDVSAFNSDEYSPKELNTMKQSTDMNVNTAGKVTNNDVLENTNKTDDDTAEKSYLHHTAHIHGNIGVTTSQQMLQSELDVAWFNLIEQITDVFLREYVIPIY